MMNTAIYQTSIDLPNRRQGKVRDLYDLPNATDGTPRLLIIASDRMSAFDVVMPTPFATKGQLLTDISTRWFKWVDGQKIMLHHLLSTDPMDLPDSIPDRELLRGRIMICKKTRVIPIECVVRGYITGSGWKAYRKSGEICGISLPEGLSQCDQLPEPIFTPSTKADEGHDENITFAQACDIVGTDLMNTLRDRSLDLYTRASKHAAARGIIMADTKFEFGFALDADGAETDELLLIDEILTPDSSRFWPADDYAPGRDQDSFDKQFLRNYLQDLVNSGQWDKTPPSPEIPSVTVSQTVKRYEEARNKLFG